MKSPQQHSKGQAVITVMFIAIIGMFITTGAIFTVANALESTTIHTQGAIAFQAAESGLEYSVLRLMRDHTYGGGAMQLGATTSWTVSVTGGPTITIQSIGTTGSVSRKMVATAHYNDLTLVIDSWKEVP